jgi:hypothetical protein
MHSCCTCGKLRHLHYWHLAAELVSLETFDARNGHCEDITRLRPLSLAPLAGQLRSRRYDEELIHVLP